MSSCSKKPSEPDEVDQYKRATAETKQSFTVYAAGEQASVNLNIKFPDNSKGKPSKITSIEVFSEGNQIYKIQKQDVNSEYITDYYTYLYKTPALKEGINPFTYTFQYEDGFQQKVSASIYAIKDKKIGTWWDKVTYSYLDTLSVFANHAKPIKNTSEVQGGMTTGYYSRQPFMNLIDGLFGEVYPLFDNDKKLQAIYVYHGKNLYESQLNVVLIKDDILKVYPDCIVTESPDKSGYILKNSVFTFRLYKVGDEYFTEVKKTP